MSQSPGDVFKELKQQYYQAWFRYHPEKAVDTGVFDHAGELTAYDDDDIGALIALDQKVLNALDEINIAELDAADRIDYRILRGAADIELHDLEEQDWRYRNPADFVPLRAIYQLLIYPVDDSQKAIKHRLQLIPDYLRGARVLLSQSAEQVVPVWLKSAVRQCLAGSSFVRDLGRHPLIRQKFTNPSRLQTLFDDAAQALEQFAHFLETDIAPRAAGNFACGSKAYRRLLNERHFMETTPGAVLELGERLFAEARQALQKQTLAMQGDEDVEGLWQKIRQQRPQPGRVLDAFRSRTAAAHKWCAESGIVSMPEKQSLKLQQTPDFLRHMIPFAAYQPPLPRASDQHGLFYVTASTDDALLAEQNDFSIDLTCVHEAFPGHHLQFVTGHLHTANNPVRQVNASASLYEGWALYCEQLAIEQGMLETDEHRFVMLRDRLWRALRVIIDVKLQTGQLSFEQAVARLMMELGFAREQAEAEINWYSSSPGVPMCYASGCEMILAARQQCVIPEGFSLPGFHDGLLAQGPIALPLAIELAFGETIWRKVHAGVFSK